MYKIGILKEEKTPPDTRVALTPSQAFQLMLKYEHVLIKAVSSSSRCFNDTAYIEMGVPVKQDVNDCEILIGVKEVPLENLIPNKTYLFFRTP